MINTYLIIKTNIMLSKKYIVMFIALSVGLWLGTSFHPDQDTKPFMEEIFKFNHIIGGLVGGLVGGLAYYLIDKRKKS